MHRQDMFSCQPTDLKESIKANRPTWRKRKCITVQLVTRYRTLPIINRLPYRFHSSRVTRDALQLGACALGKKDKTTNKGNSTGQLWFKVSIVNNCFFFFISCRMAMVPLQMIIWPRLFRTLRKQIGDRNYCILFQKSYSGSNFFEVQYGLSFHYQSASLP